jgi:hypothetical protein
MANNELTYYNQLRMASAPDGIALINKLGKFGAVSDLLALKIIETASNMEIKTVDAAHSVWMSLRSSGQKLQAQGFIAQEDGDLVYAIPRFGKNPTITLQKHWKLPIRLARRKGFQVDADFWAVPKENSDAHFVQRRDAQENIRFDWVESKKPFVRIEENIQNILEEKFETFAIRVTIRKITNTGGYIFVREFAQELSAKRLIERMAMAQDLYARKWIADESGHKKSVILTDKDGAKIINSGAIWVKWTPEMVRKTLFNSVATMFDESLPELRGQFMFDDAEPEIESPDINKSDKIIDVKQTDIVIDFENPSDDIIDSMTEWLEIITETPTEKDRIESEIKIATESGEQGLRAWKNAHAGEWLAIEKLNNQTKEEKNGQD